MDVHLRLLTSPLLCNIFTYMNLTAPKMCLKKPAVNPTKNIQGIVSKVLFSSNNSDSLYI